MAYREERVRGRRRRADTAIGGGKQGDRRQIAAPYVNECGRCGRDMESTADMVKTRQGAWIHRGCHSGADE